MTYIDYFVVAYLKSKRKPNRYIQSVLDSDFDKYRDCKDEYEAMLRNTSRSKVYGFIKEHLPTIHHYKFIETFGYVSNVK